MMEHWLLVSIVLAFLSLDVSAFGQSMVCRPIVVGPLVGWMTGHPVLGLEMGALIELIWIGDVPVGAHLPLDLTMLTGVSAAFASELVKGHALSDAAMTYAMGIAIPLAAGSTELENVLRKFHVRWMHFAQRMAMNGHFKTFGLVNTLLLAEQWLKGFLVAGLSLLLVHWTSNLFFMFGRRVIEGLYYAHWLLLALGCSAVIDLLVEKRSALYLGLSILAVFLAVSFKVQQSQLVIAMVFVGFILTLYYARKGESA
jgi:mannose/fructose/N-acetylgalactosamine-specific phosphotransferase system component IIC